MKTRWIIVLGMIFLFSLGILGEKSQAAEPMTLEAIMQEALRNNREIAALREQWTAMKHRIPQASALPDPMVGYSFMGPNMIETRVGPREEVYEFEQMIPFPGKLYEKRQMASAEAEAAEAEFKAVEREVVFKVSEAYYDLYATQAILQVTENIQELLKKFENIAQSRYASQQSEQRDVAKAQAEVSDNLKQIFILRQQKESLAAMLNALLNRRSAGGIEEIEEPKLPPLNLSLEELLERAKKNRPELLEAIAVRARDQHANALAKYEYAPDFFVGFEYSKIGEGMTTDPDDGQDAWMIPIKVTVPLWQNRIIPAVQEAKRNLKSSEAKLENIENLTEYELKNAFYRFQSAYKIVELYNNALIPQAELAFRSDQAGYEAGRTDILNLLDSERVFFNAKMAYYQAFADALKSFATIERILGADLNNKGS